MTNPSNDQVAVRLFEIRQEIEAVTDTNQIPALVREAVSLVTSVNTVLVMRFQNFLKTHNPEDAIDDIIEQIEKL